MPEVLDYTSQVISKLTDDEKRAKIKEIELAVNQDKKDLEFEISRLIKTYENKYNGGVKYFVQSIGSCNVQVGYMLNIFPELKG